MQNNSPDTTQKNSQQVEYDGLSLIKTAIVLLVIIAIAAFAVWYLNENKPEAKKSGPKQSIVSVNAEQVSTKNYTVYVASNGSVTAKTNSALIAQVSGEITALSDNFANGADFKKGDLLLTIDLRNYVAAASSAQASLSQAQANLETEQANATQAKKDWQRLGYSGEPNARVLRKPQLDAATAQFNAAKASYNKAQLDLSRTKIRAPYDGSVINKNVGLGQFVSVGTLLGNIISNQGLEIELPVNQEEYAQLDFSNNPKVVLHAELAGTKHQWQATIVRADRAFNTTTRQLNVIAEVDNMVSDNGLELKIGQYLNASIAGRIINEANVIPNSAVREGSYVFIFDDGVLRRQDISIVWQDDNFTIVNNLSSDSLVVTTSLGGAVSGSRAKLIGEQEQAKTGKPSTTNDSNKQ